MLSDMLLKQIMLVYNFFFPAKKLACLLNSGNQKSRNKSLLAYNPVKIRVHITSRQVVHRYPVVIAGLGVDDVRWPVIFSHAENKCGWGGRVVDAGDLAEGELVGVGEVELQGVDGFPGFLFGTIVRPHVGDGWELGEAAGEGVEDADDVGGVSIAQDEEALRHHGEDVVAGERVEIDFGAEAGVMAAEAAARGELSILVYHRPAAGAEADVHAANGVRIGRLAPGLADGS